MNRLRKFLRLSTVEKWLLIKATLLLGGIKLGLKLFPFQTLRRSIERLSDPSVGPPVATQYSVEEVVWAVELAGRYVPDTCLSRALGAQVLLARRRHLVRLHIGVVKEEGEKFLAHAWLESGGRVVIGGYELERYTPLVALEGERS